MIRNKDRIMGSGPRRSSPRLFAAIILLAAGAMGFPADASTTPTTLSGQVETTDGTALANVVVRNGGASAQTDAQGRFLLANLVAGQSVMAIDGRHAGPSGKIDYGYYEARITVVDGRANVLPFTSYLPRINHNNDVNIRSPTKVDTVIGTPLIPGLEIHIPAGMIITDSDGKAVTKIGITPIPIDRTPFPLPNNVYVPIYFTAQPGSASITRVGGGAGYAQVYYPNYRHDLPGARGTFWRYDPDTLGWTSYGLGSVNAAATQVVPDSTTHIYELTGAMFNGAGGQPDAAGPIVGGSGHGGGPGDPGANPNGGEPVDLGTGLFVQTQTDLRLADVIPLALTRTYRQNDVNQHAFGVGMTLAYDLYLWSANQYQEVDLLMPDGGKVHYVRTSSGTGFTDAVFATSAGPSAFFQSVISWNGAGWNLVLRDGAVYVFGENAPLQSIQDRLGNHIQLVRAGGPSGQIQQIASPNGKFIQFTRDSGNRITQAKDNAGRTVGYVYDAAGRLSTVTDPDNGVTTYNWDTVNNRVVSTQDPRGDVFVANLYDANGRVQTQTMPDSGVFHFVYTLDGAGNVTETDVTDPKGGMRKVTFNAAHYWLTDKLAVGTAVEQDFRVTRDPTSNYPLSRTDPLGRQTTWSYDANGNTLAVTALAGTSGAVTAHYTYSNAFNQLATVTDPLGHVTTFQRDALDQLTAIVDPLNHSTTFTHTPQGQVATITDALNHVTQLTYDHGDPATVVDPLSRTTTSFSDAVGRPVRITDPLGNFTSIVYDPVNGAHQTTDPTGAVTTINYDPVGNVASLVDARGGTTAFTYDNKNRLTARRDPLGISDTVTAYDLNDNPLTRIDRKGQTTTYSYDALNRIATAAYADGSTVAYTWDGGNRLTQVADSVGGTITRAWDGLDRVTSETTAGRTVGYIFDAASRRTKLTVTGQADITYAYDNANRLTSALQGTAKVKFTYDSANRRTVVTLANGVAATHTYDAASQLTSITDHQGTPTLGTLTYAYDAAGRISLRGGTLFQSIFPVALTSAAYDPDNRLTTWVTASGSVSPVYDADGNLTNDGSRAFTWDARGRLTAIAATPAGFAYDAAGRRSSATIAGATTGYVYDGADIVQELSGGSPSATLVTGQGVDERFSRTVGGVASTYLTDILGSTVALTDAAGVIQTSYAYDPYGATTTTGAANTSPYQYTGRENDGATGLYFYRARYYNPTWGRFISEDPIGLAGGVNLYSYANGNPIGANDPRGLNPAGAAIGGEIGGWVGAIVGEVVDPIGGGIPGAELGAAIGSAIGNGVSEAAASPPTGGSGPGSGSGGGTGGGAGAGGAGGAASEGTYEFTSASGKPYVGQSQDIPVRISQHLASGKLLPEDLPSVQTTEVLGGRTAREIAEQMRINQLGGVQNLENTRNPIGPARQSLLPPNP